jgi:hypothetical protein
MFVKEKAIVSYRDLVVPSSLLAFGDGMRPLTAAAAAWGVSRGLRVLVLDAANRFDPYQLAREGRQRGLRPEQVLSRVWVARAFTCHQLVQLVQESLLAQLAGVDNALVIFLGPCSLFYDEQVPLAERRRLFRSLLADLGRIKQQAALWFLQPTLPPQVANQHFGRLLARLADRVIRLGAGEGAPRPQVGHRKQLLRPAGLISDH